MFNATKTCKNNYIHVKKIIQKNARSSLFKERNLYILKKVETGLKTFKYAESDKFIQDLRN